MGKKVVCWLVAFVGFFAHSFTIKANTPLPDDLRQEAPATNPSRTSCINNDKAPKQFSISLGPVLTHRSKLESFGEQKVGGDVFFDYTYQVAGFCALPKSWIGFFSGYKILPAYRAQILEYGLTVKHQIEINRDYDFLLSYGLGTFQIWLERWPARGIGHQTQLRAGLNLKRDWPFPVVVEFIYAFHMLPHMQSATETSNFNTVQVIVGTFFNHN